MPQPRAAVLHDLFAQKVVLDLPRQIGWSASRLANPIYCLRWPTQWLPARILDFAHKGIRGFKAVTQNGHSIAIIAEATTSTLGCDSVLHVPAANTLEAISEGLAARKARWLFPKPRRASEDTLADARLAPEEIVKTWRNQLILRAEDPESETPGLRSPQIGAVYATLAHWSTSDKPATVVMPTGTGKTETMLALLVAARIDRLLVVVPNDNLRTQISSKFLELGVLRACGCLGDRARLPAVAVLRHRPKTVEEVDDVFLRANVIVSTMQIVGGCYPEIQERMAENVSALFVDEAHHIGARTWNAFKGQFIGRRRVVQFTATPFRNDGRRVDGKFIYVYPLKKAQEEKYFKKIEFLPVNGLDQNDTDQLIVANVKRVLDRDIAAGFDHRAMARVQTIPRAISLHRSYQAAMPGYNPILLHSDLTRAERQDGLDKLNSGESRIVVCVDMLGEGFDLPELKIAGLHDKQKSEAVTLQFVGRFTRIRKDLGDATVIANITHDNVAEALQSLYAEDADWNSLLSVVGAKLTEREERRETIFQGFSEEFEGFPISTLFPRMSTVIYRTTCDAWRPRAVADAITKSSSIIDGPVVNDEARLVLFVTRDDERLRWTKLKEPQNVSFNLYLAHWDDETGLLYINSSKMSDLHLNVAKALCGDDVVRISGNTVFRVLDGYRRMVLMNLGLSETQRRPVRYSQFMGSDIAEQLDTLPGNRNRTKTNLFGQGYTNEGRSTIGCSVKGKIWSYEATNNFSEWIDWSRDVGRKLLDETITTDGILRNLVRPTKQAACPAKPAIAIAWPDALLLTPEERIEILFGDRAEAFYDCDIDLIHHEPDGPIRFSVRSGDVAADFELTIAPTATMFTQTSGASLQITVGKKTRSLTEYMHEEPPHIYFADGDMLLLDELFMLPRNGDRPSFDMARIETPDWRGVDITKESQRDAKYQDSIQRRVIERLLAQGNMYEVIFDDDGTGESADVVAMRLAGSKLVVELHHCKYSAEPKVGARLDDLYKVCGQTQKSIRWRERPDIFLNHLLKRESDRRKAGRPSRFEKGSRANVTAWLNRWQKLHHEFHAVIVQPGFSKAKAEQSHLELFAATQSLLMDTWGMTLRIFASP
jgi:superfamily II DNA or RNA helicase